MNKEKSILITGAGGYIGRHVVSKLVDKGFLVTAVDLSIDKIDSRANRIALNIFNNESSLYEKLNKPQICLHLAWQDGFRHNSQNHITNLPQHFYFIKDLIDNGLKQLAVMGTMHEIGYWEGEINENTPTNPISFYGISKNCLRQIAQVMTMEKGITFQWLRAFYIIGDDLNNNSIFSKILKMENDGKSTFPMTTGENKYDFIHIEELASQIASCVIQNEVEGIINCCSGVPISLREIVERFINEKGLRIKPSFGEFPNRPYDSPAIWGNTMKINQIMKKSLID